MTTVYFDLKNGERTIKCKEMKPDSGEISSVILGIHGFCGDKESSVLSQVAERMQAHGTSLVCFDLPAHGSSEEEGENLTVKNCLSDILRTAQWCRDTYRTEKRAVFATSFGGFLALNCILQLEDFEIVLRAPAVTMAEGILLNLLGLTAEEFRKRGSVSCGFERKIQIQYSFYEELQQYRTGDMSFSRKALLIHGMRDQIVSYDSIVEFCKRAPNVRLEAMEWAGHRFKNPGECERIVRLTEEYLLEQWA